MTALAAYWARRWVRAWLTGPLHAVDLIHLVAYREYELCLIRHRARSPR